MRLYARFLLAVFLVVSVAGVFRAQAEAPASSAPAVASANRAVTIESAEQAEGIEDPRALVRAGQHHLAAGNPELARALFTKSIEREELANYFGKAKELREARVLELLGDFPGAAAQYTAYAEKDPLHTALALRIASIHPDRDALFASVVERVKALVAEAKAGKDAVIYVTSKGEPRMLDVVTGPEALARSRAFNAGDEKAKLKYCYIENLDLTELPSEDIPERLDFERCVLGNVTIPNKDVNTLVVKGFVLGDFRVGKTWSGEVNKSIAFPGSRFVNVTTRETVFLGAANFQDVAITGRKAAFPLTVFEGGADFRGARLAAPADWRFSVFGEGANFKRARIERLAYFGNARFREETTFAELSAGQDVYFDSARFEAPVHFDACEFLGRVTFENATFDESVSFSWTRARERLNMSRSVVRGTLTMKDVDLGGMDFIGAELLGDASFVDARVDGKVRFSLDDVTRARYLGDPSPLLAMYRDYQGDEDAEEPLARRTAYGVEHVDDLIARIDGNISFANSVFGGFVIFERVSFGKPGGNTVAEFYNTQFGGETHFERTHWHSTADFSTIYAQELALNEATFHRSLLLDDANVPGRVTLTDARFEKDATLSFYGAEIGTFQVDRSQVVDEETGQHRLWYERCARTAMPVTDDVRYRRQAIGRELTDADFRGACYDRAIDEFVSLKQSFGDRAMTTDEDWAYWWIKHHETGAVVASGTLMGYLAWPVRYLLFELAFGWGVRLGNLGVTALVVCIFFTVIYKRFCPDTVMSYDGEDMPLRDIPWAGVFYISLQSLGSFNTGWDFGDADMRFRYLNTAHTYIGVIILTFFVGAYTRIILA